jgi:hypothetical protein
LTGNQLSISGGNDINLPYSIVDVIELATTGNSTIGVTGLPANAVILQVHLAGVLLENAQWNQNSTNIEFVGAVPSSGQVLNVLYKYQ